MASGESTLRGALKSEDTSVMIDALRKLAVAVESADDGQTLVVRGTDQQSLPTQADIFVVNSGTTIRFLTAMLSTCSGVYRLDGNQRMRQRPVLDLVDALNQLGGDVTTEFDNGCPPVLIKGDGLTGGSATVRGDISSQFLSGLLMAAPKAAASVELNVDGPLVSQPYVRMTIGVMKEFGVDVQATDLSQFRVEAPQQYQGRVYDIEPDASAASYFWAAAAITGGTVTVEGLSQASLQGDVRFCDCLEQMGCQVEPLASGIRVSGGRLRGIETNMNAISDTVQTLAAVALFADGPTTITGVAHIRHKETDRIGDLARELTRLGAEVLELPDGLRITPKAIRPAMIETYDDHRMAMSMALVGLGARGIVIQDPGCTRKTYPEFFQDLAALQTA